jgi:rubrerythrin
MLPSVARGMLPTDTELAHDVAAAGDPILQHAIEHEEATAKFYRELAHLTPIPALKRTFATLAAAEDAHVEHLRQSLAGHTAGQGDAC